MSLTLEGFYGLARLQTALLSAIQSRRLQDGVNTAATTTSRRPDVQLFTCIDDREGSFRRHAETVGRGGIETFGVAGYFGLPIQYSSDLDGVGTRTLAPDGVAPRMTVVERSVDTAAGEAYRSRRRIAASLQTTVEHASTSPVGSLALAACLPLSLFYLNLMGYAPATKNRLRLAVSQPFLKRPRTLLDVTAHRDRAAELLAHTFCTVGLKSGFAPLVLLLGHGAASRNNPYGAAYNCGAVRMSFIGTVVLG